MNNQLMNNNEKMELRRLLELVRQTTVECYFMTNNMPEGPKEEFGLMLRQGMYGIGDTIARALGCDYSDKERGYIASAFEAVQLSKDRLLRMREVGVIREQEFQAINQPLYIISQWIQKLLSERN